MDLEIRSISWILTGKTLFTVVDDEKSNLYRLREIPTVESYDNSR